MIWGSPGWLWGLAPWAGVAAWMLLGLRRRVGVPFLALWQAGESPRTIHRRVRPPLVCVVAILVAMGLAILAAGGPGIVGARDGEMATIIVNRGISASASRDGVAGYVVAARKLAATKTVGRARVVAVPATGGEVSARREWLARIEELAPTAMDARDGVAQAVRRALATTQGRVIVVGGGVERVDDPRVFVVPAGALGANVGIAGVSARVDAAGIARVWVAIAGTSDAGAVEVTAGGDGGSASKTLTLSGRGATAETVLAVANAGELLRIGISPGGSVGADDRAWLARRGSWPKVTLGHDAPAAVRRMVGVYGNHRPTDGGSPTVTVVDAADAAKVGGPVVVIVATSLGGAAGGAVGTVDHPVTADVEWAKVMADAVVAPAGPPAGFKAVMTVGGKPAVAVREAGADESRGVWIGFDSPTFSREPGFVSFWVNALDWVGGNAGEYRADTVHQLPAESRRIEPGGDSSDEPGLTAGLWRWADGSRGALNAPVADTVPDADGGDWKTRVAGVAEGDRGVISLSSWLALLASGCLLLAAATWTSRIAVYLTGAPRGHRYRK